MTNKAEPQKSTPRRGGQGPVRPVEKAKDFKGTLRKLISYLKDYYKQITAVVIFVIIGTIMTIASPKLLGNITNQVTDDYIAIKVYEAVNENIPDNVKLPAGTTLEQLIEITTKQAESTGQSLDNNLSNSDQLKSLTDSQRDRLMQMDITKNPGMHFDIIGQIALLLIGIYLLTAVFAYARAWIVTSITQRIAYRLRRDISHKINLMPLSYFDKNSFGDVLSRITNDVDAVSMNLSQVITSLVNSVATIIGILIMMLSISVTMTAIILFTIPVSAVTVIQIVKRSQKYFKRQQDTLGKLNGHIEEIYGGHNIVKIFGSERKATAKFNRYNDSLYQSAWKSQFISGLIFPAMHFIGNMGYVATTVLGGYLVINGRIRVGDVQAFIQYIQQFNQPIMEIANISNIIQSTVAAAERVFEFLEQPNEAITWEGNGEVLDNVTGAVSFEHIKFGYSKDKTIIHDFSATVKPGQKIAIVGPTGAGKTTMINLLMRFYDPNKGIIKLDGVDTTKISRANVRKNFGMVLQDTWLFSGTIKENLLYGKPNATEKELQTAVKAARADHVIRALPDGYNTKLDENANNVSAGEKQLLTIARAMLANAPILILDEATSNVDTRTEELIQAAMDKLMEGRTSFIIAHRLSTIRNADLILVLNHGDIIESGNHAELMKQNGFYANLYNSQFAN
ncbi:MAG: ABC transporter ATP-binding protein [Candidatus Saccharibacteria bacterium]|nr:ABC transporter ATP-binding protein [Candidatus Saccharibacteria bacterium]